jgi:hypothetical protein
MISPVFDESSVQNYGRNAGQKNAGQNAVVFGVKHGAKSPSFLQRSGLHAREVIQAGRPFLVFRVRRLFYGGTSATNQGRMPRNSNGFPVFRLLEPDAPAVGGGEIQGDFPHVATSFF